MNKSIACVILPLAATFGAGTAHAALDPAFTVKVEAPKQVTTSAGFDYVGVETFDSRLGQANFISDFGGGPISGAYKGVNVIGFNQYGGAEHQGAYAVAGLGVTSSYSIAFSDTGANGINYFGYWLSALDAGNTVEFFNDGTSLGTFDPANVIAALGASSADYRGNPYTGENIGERYAFLNFYLTAGTFDQIVFLQKPGTAGYESDNHTVGWYNKIGDGTEIPGVPEPATWAMMILGIGMAGGVMRRRSTVPVPA
jgi:hypothetical protein